MAARLGNFLYWIACGCAAIIALAGIPLAISSKQEGGDWLFVMPFALVFAALVWAAGRGIRYVLAGR